MKAAEKANPRPDDPDLAWKEFGGKEEVRKRLSEIQMGLCAYCEIRLSKEIGLHIDHIKPKTRCPEKTFYWSNLLLSCIAAEKLEKLKDSDKCCGHFKLKAWDEQMLLPTDEDCEKFFIYLKSGEIELADNLTPDEKKRGKLAIDILNLNGCSRLKRERNEIIEIFIKQLDSVSDCQKAREIFINSELFPTNGKLKSFVTAKKQRVAEYQT
ncbi:MAG: TIGR02646 family protein [Candidatus Wallbacteria bacterium]|nr:TIGR02646 family protein [Candidatus Wallbacteria bacterium]